MLASSLDAEKLNQHLTLLKEEYAKLQEKYDALESKYNVSSASSDTTQNTFASRLVQTAANLYDSEAYSDIKVKMGSKSFNAHRLVLTARSNLWGEDKLASLSELDWDECDPEVSCIS